MAIKKKAVTKKTTAAPPKAKAIADKQTKAQVVTTIAEQTGVAKKDVLAVFAALGGLIHGHMQKRGSGEFQIPDTGVKIRRVKKPATKSRIGRNPATGAEIKIAARPARTVIKVSALKALKDTVN